MIPAVNCYSPAPVGTLKLHIPEMGSLTLHDALEDSALPDRQSGQGLDPGPRLKRAPAYQVPQHMGFHIVERWQFSFAQVVKSTR